MMDLESLFVNTLSAAHFKNILREYQRCPMQERENHNFILAKLCFKLKRALIVASTKLENDFM